MNYRLCLFRQIGSLMVDKIQFYHISFSREILIYLFLLFENA